MALYRVRYWKTETSSVEYTMEVNADSPEAARQRVEDGFGDGPDILTDAEWDSEQSGKEFIEGTEFYDLVGEDEIYAVVLVEVEKDDD